jgi:hypothetical protein
LMTISNIIIKKYGNLKKPGPQKISEIE